MWDLAHVTLDHQQLEAPLQRLRTAVHSPVPDPTAVLQACAGLHAALSAHMARESRVVLRLLDAQDRVRLEQIVRAFRISDDADEWQASGEAGPAAPEFPEDHEEPRRKLQWAIEQLDSGVTPQSMVEFLEVTCGLLESQINRQEEGWPQSGQPSADAVWALSDAR